jgi:hypothetical protein
MAYLRNFLQLFLALTFLFSAYTKAIAPGFFEVLLEQQSIVPSRLYGAWATRAIIAFELWLGICLLVSYHTKTVLRISFGVLAAFSTHLVYLISTGDNGNCGCFGEMISMSPIASLLKNAVLMTINGILLRFKYSEAKKPLLAWGFLSLFFAASVFVLPINPKSYESLNNFPEFEQKSGINFFENEYLVAVLNLSCEHCQEAARLLAECQATNAELPQIVALFYKEGETTIEKFNTATKSKFPNKEIDANTFFDLIGSSPPRVYWIKEGKILQYWDEFLGEDFLTTFGTQ